jgi:RluA family pseudouridine synthase
MATYNYDFTPIYEDDDLLVVNKPSGLSVIQEGWDPSAPFLVQLLRQKYPDLMIVHRLDKETSGLMVFAKTKEAHRELCIQFERHIVSKKYFAVVVGQPKWETLTAKNRLAFGMGKKHRTVVDNAKGTSAETELTVVERYNGYALVEANPKTGRTHQIRVHLYARGLPILGDKLYGTNTTDLIDRVALHSGSLQLVHPTTKEEMTFTIQLPVDIKKAIKKIKAG